MILELQHSDRRGWVEEISNINRRLRDERVNQVSVDEVQYVALGQGDIVIEDAAKKLAKAGGHS